MTDFERGAPPPEFLKKKKYPESVERLTPRKPEDPDKWKQRIKTIKGLAKKYSYNVTLASTVALGLYATKMAFEDPAVEAPQKPGISDIEKQPSMPPPAPKERPTSQVEKVIPPESPSIKVLRTFQAKIISKIPSERPRIFRPDTPDMDRCRSTEALLNGRTTEMATIARLVAQNLDMIPDQKARDLLAKHLTSRMHIRPAEIAAKPLDAKLRSEKMVKDLEWWIRGCHGYVASKIFEGRAVEFSGEYANYFSQFIEGVIRAAQERRPGSEGAPEALAILLSDLMKEEKR